MPKVSVVIPAYNSEKYIEEALDSVFNQSFQDFEVIVVDDGSTDNTRALVEKYGDRVRYFPQENGGPAKARNDGISKATGEYIAFLDADDIWGESKLEKQLACFERDPELGMVFTENYLFDRDGTYCQSMGKREKLMQGDVAQNIFRHSGLATPTVMAKRGVFEKIGVFEENLLHAEDDNMWIRIAANYSVELVDEPLVGVRDHDQRTTRNHQLMSDSLDESVKLLCTAYGDRVREKIEPVVPQKLSEIHFDIGYRFFEAEDLKNARKSFVDTIRYNRSHWKAYMYLAASMIPRSFHEGLRKLKQLVVPKRLTANKWVRDD